MPSQNLTTASRVASSLKIEWSMRSCVPARALMLSMSSSVSAASGIRASAASVIVPRPSREPESQNTI